MGPAQDDSLEEGEVVDCGDLSQSSSSVGLGAEAEPTSGPVPSPGARARIIIGVRGKATLTPQPQQSKPLTHKPDTFAIKGLSQASLIPPAPGLPPKPAGPGLAPVQLRDRPLSPKPLNAPLPGHPGQADTRPSERDRDRDRDRDQERERDRDRERARRSGREDGLERDKRREGGEREGEYPSKRSRTDDNRRYDKDDRDRDRRGGPSHSSSSRRDDRDRTEHRHHSSHHSSSTRRYDDHDHDHDYDDRRSSNRDRRDDYKSDRSPHRRRDDDHEYRYSRSSRPTNDGLDYGGSRHASRTDHSRSARLHSSHDRHTSRSPRSASPERSPLPKDPVLVSSREPKPQAAPEPRSSPGTPPGRPAASPEAARRLPAPLPSRDSRSANGNGRRADALVAEASAPSGGREGRGLYAGAASLPPPPSRDARQVLPYESYDPSPANLIDQRYQAQPGGYPQLGRQQLSHQTQLESAAAAQAVLGHLVPQPQFPVYGAVGPPSVALHAPPAPARPALSLNPANGSSGPGARMSNTPTPAQTPGPTRGSPADHPLRPRTLQGANFALEPLSGPVGEMEVEAEAAGKAQVGKMAFVGASHISEYQLQQKLGEGTFGVVWKGIRDKGKGRESATQEQALVDRGMKVRKGDVVALKEIILHNEMDGVSSAFLPSSAQLRPVAD